MGNTKKSSSSGRHHMNNVRGDGGQHGQSH